jgi:hypothetical protein
VNFKLTVVDSCPLREPSRAYFSNLEQSARSAVHVTPLCSEHAWALCEFLDAVDSGNLALEREFYRRCVAVLGEYIEQFQRTPQVRQLAGRSWAAHSLLELVLDNQLVRLQLRAVA